MIRYAILQLSTQTYTQGYKIAWLETIEDFRNHLKAAMSFSYLGRLEIPDLNKIKNEIVMNHFDGKHKLSLNLCLKRPILFEL